MEYLYCSIIGYLLGAISPSAIISKVKKVNLKEKGTKNLGATNTMLVFGKGWGAFVMVFDVLKAVVAVNLARLIFPHFSPAGILAGATTVLGHICPFYLKFKGGKGLASFAGMLLALDPVIFLFTLIVAIVMILAVNYCVAAPFTGAVVFPILYGAKHPQPEVIIIAILVSLLLALRHIPDVYRVKRGEDYKIRELIKEHLHK